MGLSNYLPSSRISQAGVCTSSTRPASPYEGQMIYETDTNRVLVYDNTAWVMIADTDTPPGLELVKTQTVGSAVSSVTVNDVFSANYENYKIIYSGGTQSTGQDIQLQMGATTTGYYGARIALFFTSDTFNYARNNNSASFGFVGTGSTGGAYANFELLNPFLTLNTFVNAPTVANPGTASVAGSYNGFLNNSTSYTAFTLIPTSSTITGGIIRVYGYRN